MTAETLPDFWKTSTTVKKIAALETKLLPRDLVSSSGWTRRAQKRHDRFPSQGAFEHVRNRFGEDSRFERPMKRSVFPRLFWGEDPI
jgi:hypothetical protein